MLGRSEALPVNPLALLLLLLLLACRDRPVCIPTPGVQLVTLTHVEDVASMLAAVPGNPAAIRQYYNVCSDRQISHTGASHRRAHGPVQYTAGQPLP